VRRAIEGKRVLRPDFGDGQDEDDDAPDRKGLMIVIGLALLYCLVMVLPSSTVFDLALGLTAGLALSDGLHTTITLFVIAIPALAMIALSHHYNAIYWRKEYFAVFFGIVVLAGLVFGRG
jgi:hypothetical protein